MLSGHPEQSEGSIIHWRDEILRFAQNDYLDLFVTCMCKRFLYRLHFKSDGMEFYGISTGPSGLPWVDRDCLSNAIEISTGDFGRLVNMTMKG
jgi:hypothetical protein